MDLSIKGKNAIVCASSQGLGKSAAIDLAKEGVNVAICSRNQEKIDLVKNEIEKMSDVKVVAIQADLSLEKDIDTLFNKAKEELKTIDILINNNGGPPPSTFDQLTDEDWQKAFNGTMMSAIRLSKLVLNDMKKNKWGRIINISSAAAAIGNKGQSNYVAAKAGIEAMSKTLAREVGSKNITVNCVAPGFIETDMLKDLDEDYLKTIADEIPLQRLGKTDEIASLVKFLASEEANYITGQTVHINGGLFM